ncbi:MAG: hypothetical protein JNG88_16820, partial [Phycisphaerales bacterium]|nr:hypothetical protein [Phycisphaerales bacterium]
MRQIQRGTMRNLIQRWNRAVVTTAGAMALSSAVWSQEMESAEPAPVAVIPMNVDIDDAQKEAMISPEARAAREGGVAGGRPTCSGDPDNLFYPLNQGTWTLVPFFGDGATGAGPAQGPAGTEDGEANDDDSAFFNFSFLFVLYGDTYGSCYINNNGNISFGQRFSTFTSQPFPIDGFPMVAPFWADVDTRTNNGAVWYRQLDSNNDGLNDTLVVTWENVGYYFQEGELRNTFQVAISNGTNPQMGLGYNVLFSYDNMCWTTGDASGGTNGFGGTASTVGAN